MGDGQIALPSGIAGIGCGEAAADSEVFGKGGLGGVEFALCFEDAPDAAVGDRQLALPADIAGIGCGEAAADSEVFGKCSLSGVEFSLRFEVRPRRGKERRPNRAASPHCWGRLRRGGG